MAKKTLLLVIALLLVLSVSSFAGEGSDTVGGGKLLPQLRYGYLSLDWKTNSSAANGFKDWDVSAHNYYVQANWGIFNNVDLIALVGGRSICMDSDYTSIRRGHEELMAYGLPAFMWGLGVKGTFFRADNGFYVGGGALFTHTFTNDFDFKYYDDGVHEGNFRANLSVYMLTPELHVGYHLKNIGLTPYLGVDYVWSRAVSEVDGLGDIVNRPEHPVYMFTGLDYYLNDKLYVKVEGRTNFIDGWGVETGVGYLFDICPKPAPAPEPEPAPPIEPKLEPMSKN